MEEILKRVWESLFSRLSGPLNFRFLVQPAVASFLAIRAGVKDAQQERPAFSLGSDNRSIVPTKPVWAILEGCLFVLAIVLDTIYQLIVQRGVYLLELLIVATILALVPYLLLRGPVSRCKQMSAAVQARAFNRRGAPSCVATVGMFGTDNPMRDGLRSNYHFRQEV